MSYSEELLDDLADAVLGGEPIDWASAESSAGSAGQPLVRSLRLVASVADVHRDALPVLLQSSPTLDRWGHLQLLERVGSGTFGEVFRAWDTRLDREVALKLLPTETSGGQASTSIIGEGRLLAKVRHPNVVTIHGAEQIGDRIGLWMEFVRGQTLEQLIQRGRVLPSADVIELGIQLSRAVSAVHAAGLLHRDIKAHNVTRTEDGRVVLMDFGTGRELDDAAAPGLAGTPLYLAPEVLAGGPATTRSDIYSLGVVMYHLLTASYPVSGQTIEDVRRAHGQGRRTALRTLRPDVRAGLARVIERAIDPDPKRRYASADDLARDLTALQSGPWAARLQYAMAGAAALLLVAVATSEVGARLAGDHRSLWSRLRSIVEPANPVIAVLPFENLGSEPASADLVDGLTIGLIQQLAGLDGLDVRAETSSSTFRNTRDSRSAGRALSATHVVRATAQVSDGMLRVNPELIRVRDGRSLWSASVERRLTSSEDVFAIQDEIARALANGLRVKLGRGQRRYDTGLPLPQYYQFAKARALQARRGIRSSRQAAALLEEIVTSHPEYAPAWAGLASTRAYIARLATPDVGLPSEQDLARIRVAALRATDLDPLLAEAHAARGVAFAYDREWQLAETAFEQALQLNPSRTTTHTDFVLSTLYPQDKLEEALQRLDDARRADPLSLDVQRVTASIQLDSGRYADAIESCRRVLARDANFPFVQNLLARALTLNGQPEDAVKILEQLPGHWGALGYAYGILGRRDAAEALAAQHSDPGMRAVVFAGIGDKERALTELERLASMNWWLAAHTIHRAELALLRRDPRIAALREKLELPKSVRY